VPLPDRLGDDLRVDLALVVVGSEPVG